MAANLQTMLTMTRVKIGDLSVRKVPESLLVMAANEGKNELVKIIRQAHKNYFEDSTTGTIATATPPNPSDITLPNDFAELKEIMITDTAYQDTGFIFKNHSAPEFKEALIMGGGFANGMGNFYYDIVGERTLRLAPGADIAMNYLMHYVKTIPDMVLPQDAPIGIPPEHWDFIVTWMICEAMRSIGDPKLDSYISKLEFQKETVLESVNDRQTKDPRFVRGYMQEEQW
jgi:hypothetical protein